MESILKSDIFFVIVAVESIILTVLFSIALYYCIRMVKNMYEISTALHASVKTSGEFVSDFFERFERNGIFRLLFPKRKKAKSLPKN